VLREPPLAPVFECLQHELPWRGTYNRKLTTSRASRVPEAPDKPGAVHIAWPPG
jgi:hypothetical protein